MKKKTKFKLKNSLTIPYWISIVICLIGAYICLQLFCNSFFRALTKQNESPIAEITFKYRTAQRKFLERVVWDRLRQHSPIYNGDTINTADLSEAEITFQNGTTLNLADNSMAQVFLHDDGTFSTDLKNGFATIDSAENSSMLLTSENITFNVQGGTTISAHKPFESNDISLTVQNGIISLSNGETLTGGTALINSQGLSSQGLTVIKPAPVQKLLNFTAEKYAVDFEWQNSNENEQLILLISSDKNFKSTIQSVNLKNANSITMDFQAGTYYWKLYSESNPSKEKTGKLQILQTLKPQLLTPQKDYSYKYRKSPPSVRFIWSESENASAYNIVISKNTDLSNPIIVQRSSNTSVLISTLEKGTYYWQITPFYSINKTGLKNPSEISTFKIEQNDDFKSPAPLSPGKDSFINKNSQNITLSWKTDNDAQYYNLIVSDKKTLDTPIINIKTENNFYTIPKDKTGKLKEGQYFWAVTQTDASGTTSERSEICSFYVSNGEIEQRTIFPTDNYSIWQPLLTDITFTWKNKLPFKQSLQIAKDEAFNNIVFNKEVISTSYSGINLKNGTYFWRIYGENNSFVIKTPPKRLIIVGELEAPLPVDPSATKKCAVRPDSYYEFKWEDASNADYYRLRIFKNNGDSPLFDQNYITGTTLSLNMRDFEEGTYEYDLQGFCYESESSSRRNSTLGKSSFMLKKIKPVELVSPANGAVIDGWTAIEKPLEITWRSPESFSDAELILTKKTSSGKRTASDDVRTFKITGTKFRLPVLSSGEYEWTIKASTWDDFDISASSSRTFRIEKIKPFDAPSSAETEGGNLFDAAYLRKSPVIKFKWDSVQRANAYVLSIYKGRKLMSTQILHGNNNTSYEFKDMISLSKGEFIWKVKAVILGDDKKEIIIDGNESDNSFTIDYSLSTTGAKRKDTGALYGQ